MAENKKKRTYTKQATTTEKPKAEVTAEKVMEYPQVEGVTPTIAKEQKAPVEKETFTAEQVQKMIAEAVAQAQKQDISSKLDEMVTVLYLDECSPRSTLEIPGYGTMRPYGYLEVPKREFGNKFMSALVRKLIDKRILIVMSGLTQAERERWNCDYKEGEVLDEYTFDKLLDFDTPKLAAIFEKLCPEHQKFVACRMITAKENKDNRISVEKAKKINKISKKTDPNGMLKPILEAFSAEITG